MRVTCGKPAAGVPKAGVSVSSTVAAGRGARGTPRQSPYTEPAPQAPPGSRCSGWPPRRVPGPGGAGAACPWWAAVGPARRRPRGASNGRNASPDRDSSYAGDASRGGDSSYAGGAWYAGGASYAGRPSWTGSPSYAGGPSYRGRYCSYAGRSSCCGRPSYGGCAAGSG